ncbi:cytokinin dehydrogenase 5-like [Dorcoceras hygrometricum]|uniref:cytokinin dehydrogenase n=1 Tax=Dorcoceras hygrometricum TaxID=472368 RepID=A0A2Z7BAA7_9LAMI|nr:cytokinin dehydrogenase 5-like [Dorcoceras hygrometricum]
MVTKFLLTFAICRLIVTVGLAVYPTEILRSGDLEGHLSMDPSDVVSVSRDFGGLSSAEPMAVLYPASSRDVARLVRSSYESARVFGVSARGHGHSINGQAMTGNGVVIQMSGHRKAAPPPRVSERLMYVDVWGGELWIDVLRSTLEYGLAPKSWTDYLYLSVGGTISNAGISGQAFNHGPQISNVHELEVVTGKGELVTCSEDQNRELYHAVLGGLGQFGIITRARIALERAPQKVRWIRVLYSNFSAFTEDQEFLISLHRQPEALKFDYVEGFVIVDEGLINNWRSSFFSPRNPVISSLHADGGVLYCLEIAKNYHQSNALAIDQEVEALLKKLKYIPGTEFTTDLPYVDFLDRVHKAELKLRAKNLWDVPHPWLNLFVPKSRIADLDEGVFKGILGNKTSGPILIYPMNKSKWDERNSVVTPNESVFYLVAFLRSALDNGDETQTLKFLENQNQQILRFCEDRDIQVKQYLPHYTTQQEWMRHFGDKWELFSRRKMEFDPRNILANGQAIFKPYFDLDVASL